MIIIPVCMKRAIKLNGSDDILEWPDGSIEKQVLENILDDACEKKLKDNRLVLTTKHKRIEKFNPENPAWMDAVYRRSLRTLKKWYKQITGENFKYDSERKGPIFPRFKAHIILMNGIGMSEEEIKEKTNSRRQSFYTAPSYRY